MTYFLRRIPKNKTNFRQLLTDDELSEVIEACEMAIELNANKLRIYEFVESRMTFIAPNLSVIIGASTAAKLMGNCDFFQFPGSYSLLTEII